MQRSDSDALRGIGPCPVASMGKDRMSGGFIASLLLHGLVVLVLLLALPRLAQVPTPLLRVAPINLVQLGEYTVSPPAAETAPLPQQQAREVAAQDPPQAVPLEQEPPPQDSRQESKEEAATPPLPATRPEPTPRIPSARAPRPDASRAARQQQQPLPADPLTERLAALSQLRQPAAPVPTNPRQQDGSGQSNKAATSADSLAAHDAAYGVRDFIRAQVERRWNPDSAAIKPGWSVAIHIVLFPDGSVSRAEIVDERRYRSDRAYHAFALSARNAVLLSSPLAIPPGRYELAKDIVIEFDPRRVRQ